MNTINLKKRKRPPAGNTSITGIIVIAVAAIIALILGVQLGSADYAGASTWLIIGLGIAYVTHLHRYSWQIGLVAACLGFIYYPLGFAINSQHIGISLGVGLAGLYLIAPLRFRPSRFLKETGFGGLMFWLLLWLVYGAAHFIWNYMDPFLPSEYALKNAIKSYVEAFGGPALILWFALKPNGFRVGKNWGRTVIVILFISLVVNVAIRFYHISIGFGMEANLMEGDSTMMPGQLVIPVLNMVPDSYALRFLSPLAMAFALSFVTSREWMARQSGWTRFILWMTLVLAIVGAGLSAGRAVILLTGFYAVVIALLRQRIMLVAGFGMAGLIFLAVVNVFSSEINQKAPYYVQRSLQYFMIEKGIAARSIESSTLWRKELAERAFDEWLSEPRITMFGRATYSYSEADQVLNEQVGGYEAGMQSSLRRGAAHRLIADCLIQYGSVGLILYYLMMFATLRFLIKLYRLQKRTQTEYRELTFILLASLWVSILLTVFASGWISPFTVWLTLLLIIGYAGEVRDSLAAAPTLTPVVSDRTRRPVGGKPGRVPPGGEPPGTPVYPGG